MKFTLDTNFLISATQWKNSVAHKLLIKLIEADAQLFTTKEIIEEFNEVLIRDFKYSNEEVENIIEKILFITTLVSPSIKLDIIKDDPDDNIVLECAQESNSEYIITYDKHLLKLKEYQGIKIIKPEDVFGLI
ncbi:putative toxin-antitoxin system toxin component, PIN family [Candidatus Pacearchaeota archaeon CG10_big_fil_rev_8_21_14_0_10_32_14]|nr:MAG: putative toxin-antitoxin system toxin component, PIN family [Candidatus Pacearchaeota archaeon CG10_big_fil_rev_8_21_14_0_10_32_14]